MTHRGPFQPLPSCDSVCSGPNRAAARAYCQAGAQARREKLPKMPPFLLHEQTRTCAQQSSAHTRGELDL